MADQAEVSSTPVGLRPVWRILLVWLITAVMLLLLAWWFPGVHITGFATALCAAALLGVLNALVWPLLVRLALPLTVLTLGLAPLALNGVTVGLVAWALPGMSVDGFWWGFAVAAGLTAISMLLTAALALDDDDVVLRHLRRHSRSESGSADEPPGVVFLQIDGLALPVLRRAIRDGNAPTISGWIQSGSHQLTGWITDWSSQTGASQAGILLGSNVDMPAFRWLEKETGRVFVSNRPRHAAEIEKRHSNGRGLLYADGASRGNIFTGDAEDAVLTMASAGRKHGRIGAGYEAYFSHPSSTMRTLIGVLADAAREMHQAAVQRRRNVRPRVHRGGIYPLLRAFTTVLTRDVIVATVIGDMHAGRSVIYADFVGYDEVAHHSGVERYDALDTLRRLDHEFARLHRAAQECRRDYEFVLLSDHGQSQGATFRTRYGETLAELVARVLDAPAKTPTAPEDRKAAGEESWGYAGGALTEVAAGPGMVARVAGRLHRERPEEPAPAAPPSSAGAPGKDEAVVLASGNCALIYLTRETERLTSERIADLYPNLLPSLVEHPGIGFVLVRSQQRGPVVIGANGELELATGRVTGSDPLAPFGPHARAQVTRTDTFPHCADVMVNSLWDSQTDEVAAFEELVGSHGGLGGDQTRPFLLYPCKWQAPAEELLGPEALHRQLRRWLAHVGQSAYDDAAAEEAPHGDVRRFSNSS